MTDWGWHYPPGVSTLPGESRAEVAYQRAYEDDEGYARAVREAWEELIREVGVDPAGMPFSSTDPDVLYRVGFALGMDLPSREEYAQRVADSGFGYPDDDSEEPFE